MHIQVDPDRLKIAYENRKSFFKALNAKKQVEQIVSEWNIFSDFPIEKDTKSILNKKEYFLLCKFEHYFKFNKEKTLIEEENNVISLD